eukprot:m.52713 g.52713  ORF g.52713 m.52713 type:complete len:441 (-) comp10812_c0_seq7:981-2303(-)
MASFFRSGWAFLNHPATRKFVRGGRMIVLGYGVYVTGKYVGIQDIAEDPDGYEKRVLRETIMSFNSKSNLYRILPEYKKSDTTFMFDITKPTQPQPQSTGKHEELVSCPALNVQKVTLNYQNEKEKELQEAMERIQKVGSRLLNTLRIMVDEELTYHHNLKGSKKLKPGEAIPDGNFQGLTLNQLYSARKLLHLVWEFVVLDTDSARASTMPHQPRRLFVHAPLATACKNDTELAMILAHVLTHAVAGHDKERMWIKLGIQVSQLAIVAMLDPTGLLSLMMEGALMATSAMKTVEKYFGHQHDHVADEIGLNIITRACYDPSLAVKFYKNLHSAQEQGSEVGQTSKTIPGDIGCLLSDLVEENAYSTERILNLETALEPALSHYQEHCLIKEDLHWFWRVYYDYYVGERPPPKTNEEIYEKRVLKRRVVFESIQPPMKKS